MKSTYSNVVGILYFERPSGTYRCFSYIQSVYANRIIPFWNFGSWISGGYDFPTTNTWYQIVLTKSKDYITTYVDGNYINRNTGSSESINFATNRWLGKGGDGGNWQGKMASLDVYNTTLTAEEVKALYLEDTNPTTDLYLKNNGRFRRDLAYVSQPYGLLS